MRKNKFLAALAIAACLATSVPLSASAATLGQAASASEVTYGTVSVADQAKIKEIFVAADYAELNPDLVAAGLTGDALFNHFIKSGLFEGRQCNKNFNVAVYRSAYADLQKEFGNDLVKYYVHYAAFGKAEGRKLTTVEAAKENGVEVKSLFSDKVILDKVAAPAASTSSSNSGSTTPAKEKTPEEIAAEEEAAKKAAEEAEAKKNEELAQRDYESEVKYPANNGSGKKVAFANPARVAVAVLGTTSTVSKDYSEVELKNNIEYDYASGKFFDASKPMDPTATKVVRELDEAHFFVSVNGKYFQLEDVNGAHALTPDVIFAGLGSGVDGYDNALAADDAMLIRKGDASTANNKNTGFINKTLSKVTSEEAIAEGINLKYWTKGADGYWYPIVTDEKEAYKKTDLVTAANPQGWNYKTNAAGEIQWHYTVVAEGWRVPNVFVRRGTQNVDTFVITEKGSLRKVTDETATNNGKDVYANTFLASVPGLYGYTTISEAGKDGFKDALARNAAFLDESKAMFFGVGAAADILGYKDKNDVNVGQINNEFFNVKPAEGYFLDYNRNAAAVWPEGGVAGVGNYLYTDDYKAACDFNSRDYMVLNGKIVKKTPYNFTADEEKEARYVKDGYLRYQGSYYKIIAEKATSNNNWLPSTYVYKNAYNSDVFCVYDNTKTYTWEQASVAGTELEVLPGYVKVDVGAYGAGINATLGAFIGALPAGALKTELQAKYATTGNDENLSNRYYYFKEVTVSAKPAGGYNNEVFDLADDNDVEWTKQYTVNGRFYLTK